MSLNPKLLDCVVLTDDLRQCMRLPALSISCEGQVATYKNYLYEDTKAIIGVIKHLTSIGYTIKSYYGNAYGTFCHLTTKDVLISLTVEHLKNLYFYTIEVQSNDNI